MKTRIFTDFDILFMVSCAIGLAVLLLDLCVWRP